MIKGFIDWNLKYLYDWKNNTDNTYDSLSQNAKDCMLLSYRATADIHISVYRVIKVANLLF